jgi:hypothetical protein
MMRSGFLAASIALAGIFPGAVSGHGAVAIGLPPDVAKGGFAIGYSNNWKTPAEAEAGALQKCRTNADAPASTLNLCGLVLNFSRQCLAVAIDPAAGTPGWGWALGESEGVAETRALAMCHSTAGSRASFCVLSRKVCDTTP